MGVLAGLDADGPVLGGVAVCVARIFSGTLTKFSQLIPEMGDLLLGVQVSCTSRKPTLNHFCYC